MRFLSDLYDISSKGNLRGKTKEGLIRPTISQFYTCDKPFIEVVSVLPLTGYTADQCEGGTVGASGGGWGAPSKVFDNTYGDPVENGWGQTRYTTIWIWYGFTEPKRIRKVNIMSFYERGLEAVKDFYIDASNTSDFTSPTLLYTGQHPNETTTTFVEYPFENDEEYLYYRLVVTSNWPGNGGNNVGITEIEMMEGIYG